MKNITYSSKRTLTVSFIISVVFVACIIGAAQTLGRFQSILLPDAGAAWYYWKLPAPDTWATVTAWALYAMHQLSVWFLLFKRRSEPMAPKGSVGRMNILLLAVNAVFVVLHILQTMFFYDGLAQQVPVMTSQGSVIVMLVMILILMNRRRGLFFGKKVPLPEKGVSALRTIHGYFISWAIIYTFWFHPTEGTLGHLLGFFYIFLLMIQLSMVGTQWHFNVKWITLLEVYVAFHGAIVAIEAKNGMWPMFFFGFMMMFIVTQMYGILKNKAAITGIILCYAALALSTYLGVFGSGHTIGSIHQITWIPVILYGLVFAIVILMQIIAIIWQKAKPKMLSDHAGV